MSCLGKGLKACMANIDVFNTVHSYTHHAHVSKLVAPPIAFFPFNNTAEREVFTKTFAFFCTLQEHGCAFSTTVSEFVDIDIETDLSNENIFEAAMTLHSPMSCLRKLIMCTNRFNQRFIQ
jgi:hypothetical protein